MLDRPFVLPGVRPTPGARWLGVLLAAIACGAPKIEKPPAPDMSGLVDSYDNPTATFAPEDAGDVAVAVVAVDGLLAQTNLREQLIDVLGQVLDQAVDLSKDGTGRGLSIQADGYMLVTRVCSGWTEPATPDRAANGALLVTATFSRSGLDPIVWGSASTCRYLAGDTRIELDQSGPSDAVSVYWGDAVEQQALSDRALLVDLNLDASIDDQRLALDFDFRSLADGTVEYRIQRPDGSLIAHVGDDDSVTLRAANGIFSCNTDLECSPGPGGS